MAIVQDYVSGTVSVTNGTAAVTGVGTAWTTASIRPGDMFMRAGSGVAIASVTDDTHLVLAESWPGTSLAASAYRIRFQPDGSRYTAAATALVETLANGTLVSLAGLTGSAGQVPIFTGSNSFSLASFYVATRTALRALDTTVNKAVHLIGEGDFDWRLGDYSAQVAADTAESNYVKATAIAASVGAWVRVLRNVITPFMFGAVGDGATNDTAAFNAMWAYVRTAILADGQSLYGWKIDQSGGKWKIGSTGINATGITGWNLLIGAGYFYGTCTGYSIYDLTGSRGWQMETCGWYGDPTNRPTTAIQSARCVAFGSCDNWVMHPQAVMGNFSIAQISVYGAESFLMIKPKLYHYNPDGRAIVLQGYDQVTLTSAYQTLITGPCSFTNWKITGADFRYLPIGNGAAVTDITNAVNPVVSAPGHNFANGAKVVFTNGFPGFGQFVATVSSTNIGAGTFVIDINTTSMGAFQPTAAGVYGAATKSPVLLCDASNFSIEGKSYIVSYGMPSVEVHFRAATHAMRDFNLDLLFEGGGSTSNIAFFPHGVACQIFDYKLNAYNANASASIMSLDITGASANLTFVGADVKCPGTLLAVPLVNNAPYFAMYGADVHFPLVNTPWATMGGFTGTIRDVNTGDTFSVNSRSLDAFDKAYTPTVTASSGTFTTLGTVVGNVRGLPNKMTYLDLDIPITTNGSAAASMRVTLPAGVTAVRQAFIMGREEAVLGKTVLGFVSPASSIVTILNYDNTYPGGTGYRMRLSGWFERT